MSLFVRVKPPTRRATVHLAEKKDISGQWAMANTGQVATVVTACGRLGLDWRLLFGPRYESQADRADASPVSCRRCIAWAEYERQRILETLEGRR